MSNKVSIETMIDTLRFKAENIKSHIEPEFFNDVADVLEKFKLDDVEEGNAALSYKTKEEFKIMQQEQYAIDKLKKYVPKLKELHTELDNIQGDYTPRYVITKLPSVYEERMDAIAPKILAALSIVVESLEEIM